MGGAGGEDGGESGDETGDGSGGEADDENDGSDESPEEEAGGTISDGIPELYLRAVNPGYGKDNAGEMIEIARKDAGAPISLAGVTVSYTNSSGNESVLLEFPENSSMTGEVILLRLASSPESGLANVTYTKTLALGAELALAVDGEVVDEVCWTGKEGCAKKFDSKAPTTLVRQLETGEWAHLEEYEPEFAAENYVVTEEDPEGEPGEGEDEPGEDGEEAGEAETGEGETEPGKGGAATGPAQCQGLQFSEILSYYETEKGEQFVEFYNSKTEEMRLDGCVLRYKNKDHVLSGMVAAEGYVVYYPNENGFTLTKNPTNTNELLLIDTNGAEIDKMEYPNGQRKGTAYAWVGYDGAGEEIWQVTYAPTPGEANNYQEFKTCEAGKVLNAATGNCVKATTVTAKTCAAGYYLNPSTGRCNKLKTTTATTTSECKEGYYRDPTTKRCRKIKENDGAGFELAAAEPAEYQESSSFVALYAVAGVAAVGGAYLVYEFRHDIGRVLGKLARKVWRR